MSAARHKRIYALTVKMEPGKTIIWTNPRSMQTQTWTVPDDGDVLFYVGETSMTVPERWSKHRTFAKKLITHLAGIETIDPHHYPVYYFTKDFCGELGGDFEAHILQDGPGDSEATWIAWARGLGHPLQNTDNGSYRTEVGGRKDDGTWQSDFRKLNEQHFKPKKIAEPKEDEVIAARTAWIAARKAKEQKS
jgi:hypothetical protein